MIIIFRIPIHGGYLVTVPEYSTVVTKPCKCRNIQTINFGMTDQVLVVPSSVVFKLWVRNTSIHTHQTFLELQSNVNIRSGRRKLRHRNNSARKQICWSLISVSKYTHAGALYPRSDHGLRNWNCCIGRAVLGRSDEGQFGTAYEV